MNRRELRGKNIFGKRSERLWLVHYAGCVACPNWSELYNPRSLQRLHADGVRIPRSMRGALGEHAAETRRRKREEAGQMRIGGVG